MKKTINIALIIGFFAGLLLLVSCEDQQSVDVPNFEVAFNSSAKVGEPIEFMVSNSANFMSFYPGDFGHKYEYRDRNFAEGTVTMSFLNAQKWGLGSNAQGTLTVWYSKDYDGSDSVEAVKSATWVDITDKFNISTLYDFTLQESGVVDITDLADDNPIYFGFKYFSDNVIDRGAEWWIDDLSIKMEIADAPEPLTVASEVDPGFNSIDVQGIVPEWNGAKWYWSSDKGVDGLWRMRGNSDRIVNEDWLITNAIYLTKVNPDQGIQLKSYAEKLDSFTYTYTTPGEYTITFVGKNTTIYGSEESIKEFTITVTE